MGVSNASFPSPGLKSKQSKLARKKQQTAKKARKPLVQFNDNLKIEFIRPHAADSKPFLWWTREERRDIAEKNLELAQEFRDYHQDKVEHCEDVFEQCCSDATEASSHYLEQAKVEVPGLVRGLEWGFLPSAKAHRRIHSKQVMQAQAQVKNLPNEEMKHRLLSTRAIKSSRPSRVMARILGESDAEASKEKPLMRRNRCRMIPSWWYPSREPRRRVLLKIPRIMSGAYHARSTGLLGIAPRMRMKPSWLPPARRLVQVSDTSALTSAALDFDTNSSLLARVYGEVQKVSNLS